MMTNTSIDSSFDPTAPPPLRLEFLPTRLLTVAPEYQRPEKAAHIAKIEKRFDWSKFGAVVVMGMVARDDFWIVDGQQRVAAALNLGIPVVPAVIVTGYFDISELAQTFVGINRGRKSLAPIELHKAGIASGDAVALGLERAVTRVGLQLTNHGPSASVERTTNITCIKTLEGIFRRGGEQHLEKVLLIASQAWDYQPIGFSERLLKGLSKMLRTFPQLEASEVAVRLRDVNPRRLYNDAATMSDSVGGDQMTAVASLLVKAYNKNKKNRLDAARLNTHVFHLTRTERRAMGLPPDDE